MYCHIISCAQKPFNDWVQVQIEGTGDIISIDPIHPVPTLTLLLCPLARSFSGAPTPQLTQSLRQGMPQLQLAPFPTLQIISSHDSAMASTAAGNPTSECSVLTRDLYPMSGFTDPSGRGARPSSKPANRALAAIMTPGSGGHTLSSGSCKHFTDWG